IWLRRGRRDASGRDRAHAPELERRDARRLPASDAADPGRAVPSGGLARPARRQRALRTIHRRHGAGRSRPILMPLSLEVALGYLRSRPSKLVSSVSLLSIGGIALGVAALVVAMGLLSGYRTEIQEKLVGANAEVVGFPLT